MKRNDMLEKEIEELWCAGHAEALKYFGGRSIYNFTLGAAVGLAIVGGLQILHDLIRAKVH